VLEQEHSDLQNIGLTNEGHIQHVDKKSVEEDRYLSYIAHEDFETLSVFSIGEVSNLLASTDHRQRLYAFDMLTKGLKENSDVVLRKLFTETSGIPVRLL
jgi:hypothetical protein